MIDLDALLQPIELARTPAEARSAMWAVLKQVRHSAWDTDANSRQVFRNILAAIDAVAWCAGLTEGFRANACITAWRYAGCDNDPWQDAFHVIPAAWPASVEPGALTNA